MSKRLEELRAKRDQIDAETRTKLGLNPDEDWRGFISEQEDPDLYCRYNKILKRIAREEAPPPRLVAPTARGSRPRD